MAVMSAIKMKSGSSEDILKLLDKQSQDYVTDTDMAAQNTLDSEDPFGLLVDSYSKQSEQKEDEMDVDSSSDDEDEEQNQSMNDMIFVYDIIQIASKDFKPGYKISKEFKSKESKSSERFPRNKDLRFTYNANLIAETNFIAAVGPQTYRDFDTLLLNTVFHPSLPTRKIIALGHDLHQEGRKHHTDFVDYFITMPEQTKRRYSFSINKDKLNIPYEISKGLDTKHLPVVPKGIGQSYVNVYPKNEKENVRELEVTCIPLLDNHSIYLDYLDDLDNDRDNLKKELLWKIIKESKSERFLVHCAAGIGRTGHLILTLEIVKHYKEIFEAKDPNVAAAKILEIVNRMRKDRYCLIQVTEQLEGAIRNAHILYQYGLKKGYINQNTLADTDIDETMVSPKPAEQPHYTGDYTELTVVEAKEKALINKKFADFIDKINLNPNPNVTISVEENGHLKITAVEKSQHYRKFISALNSKAKHLDLDYSLIGNDPDNCLSVSNDQDPEALDKFLSIVIAQSIALIAEDKQIALHKDEQIALHKKIFADFIAVSKFKSPKPPKPPEPPEPLKPLKPQVFINTSCNGALEFAFADKPKSIKLKDIIKEPIERCGLKYLDYNCNSNDGHPPVRLRIETDQKDSGNLNMFLSFATLVLNRSFGIMNDKQYRDGMQKLNEEQRDRVKKPHDEQSENKQVDSRTVSTENMQVDLPSTNSSEKTQHTYFQGSKESQANKELALQQQIDIDKPSVLKATFG